MRILNIYLQQFSFPTLCRPPDSVLFYCKCFSHISQQPLYDTLWASVMKGGNFTLYLGHFPNTYCFTSPTMCVISPTILLHFPNNFASFPQQYGSFPQQYGSLPQQYESFPQLVFSFPQQFCVTFPNPQKQISPPKKAFFTNLRAIYHVKVPPPQPPFHVFSTISC